ncbi:MAG: beta-lactamase family protein [Gammaproteobacteria bacterium]|nr:beta-lactamase family protein [Gammaproteobacteria bacterium]
MRPARPALLALILAAAPARPVPVPGEPLRLPGIFFAQSASPEEAPPGTDTPFPVGSLTKTYVAALSLRLAAEGRLRLDDAAARWLPELAAQHPTLAKISLRDLLQHRSGLFDYTELPGFSWHGDWSSEQAIAAALAHRPFAEPGRGLRYANTNYLLAGKILETAGSKPLTELLRIHLVQPLGLQHTRFAAPGETMPQPGRHGRVLHAATWPRAADAGLISTGNDLNRLLHGLFADERFLPADLRREMTHFLVAGKTTRAYGLGLMRDAGTGPSAWWHGGTLPGYRAAFYWLPEKRCSLVMFSRRSDEAAERFIAAARRDTRSCEPARTP